MKKCLRIFKVNETREKIKNCQRGRKIICENLKPQIAEGTQKEQKVLDLLLLITALEGRLIAVYQQPCKTEGEIYGVIG